MDSKIVANILFDIVALKMMIMKRYFRIWIVNAENNKFSKKSSDVEFKRTKDSNRIRKIRKVFEDRCEYFIQLALKMMIRNIGKKIF